MTLFHTTFATPVGSFSLAVNEAGALVGTAFGEFAQLRRRLKSCGLATGATFVADDQKAAEARRQVRDYFAKKRRAFDLPVATLGSPFQRRVWSALQAIGFGEVTTYGAMARRLQTAARAVGRANATNPVCLIVPCHRVIGADGSLTGFAFGETTKQKLLDHERSL